MPLTDTLRTPRRARPDNELETSKHESKGAGSKAGAKHHRGMTMNWRDIPMVEQPPIEHTSAAGLVARMHMQGGKQRELARKHLRRRYNEGVQLAFCYYENGDWSLLQLSRLRRFMEETA